jgi:hypothetical protein
MTQPDFVPFGGADQVRPALRLEAPRRWTSNRPAEQQYPARSIGGSRGTPGPDQGYAMLLARRFEDRLVLTEGEHAEDVLLGCALLGARRCGLVGRAPTVYDVEAALTLWGFLTVAPPGLVEVRRLAFSGVSHDYPVQRALMDRVPESALRQSPMDLAVKVAAGDWPALVGGISA